MSLRIEDYALIGDTQTAALVGLDGSIDWLCLPRFDSPACFAALVGEAGNGRWRIGPAAVPQRVERAYRDETLVLETTFHSAEGSFVLTDCMLLGRDHSRLTREVHVLRGRADVRMEYAVRFDYGSVVPWVRRVEAGLLAIAGPDALLLASDVELRADGDVTVAEFSLSDGASARFELTYFASHEPYPDSWSAAGALEETERWWRGWSGACSYSGPYRAQVVRSLLTLKALTYAPTGGIVAAVTTSLPECLGGIRNWDYRYCWLRDATFTLYALLSAGYVDSAADWRSWLLRAVAGEPGELQIVYSIRGARRLPETELPWLDGYEESLPVRIGNDAHGQFQLDVYGEVIDLLFTSHRYGISPDEDEWSLFKGIVGAVEDRWRQPDRGLWEIRGEPRHFTHSKVMAWVALDRAIKVVEQTGFAGPVERWRATRDAIHADVCAHAFDSVRDTFTQYYGSEELDAATLLLPIVGFLPPEDPRVRGTVAAVEQHLMSQGLVFRYTQGTPGSADGLPAGEGAFLACSFWLVDNYVLAGREPEARALFERLISLRNDVGLLSEEYDPRAKRQLGNVPQAFSHVGLVNSAFNLSGHSKPAEERSDRKA